jgi:hypothetical protein
MRGERSGRAFVLLIAVVLASALFVACGSGSEQGSDQFRDQTKSPLLDFGEEGSKEELEEGAAAVEDFFTARAGEDWATACAQLARPMLDKIEHLAISATDLEDKSCPSFLGAFTQLSAKERKDSKIVDAGSLRKQGQRAFLIYYGAEKVVYSMPLNREGDAWKLASLSADPLS